MRFFLYSFFIFFVADLRAQVVPATVTPNHSISGSADVDPTIHVLRHHIITRGIGSPVFGNGLGPSVDTSGLGTLAEFSRPLASEDRKFFERQGWVFRTKSPLGNVHRAWIPFAAFDQLKVPPNLQVRIQPTWQPVVLFPLEATRETIGSDLVNHSRRLGSTGKGVRIATLDSGIDPLHPHFFRANGPYFSWIDTNSNGVFDPGIDAIDLNSDGDAQLNEILRVMKRSSIRPGQDPEPNTAAFRASHDWVFADLNRDGARNFGAEEGFGEDDPSYGEPLFVVDDLNNNGQLDVGEKLILLSVSKIASFDDGNRVFKRGVDLIEAVNSPTFPNAFHGTGVASILAGGQDRHHARVGIAPGAELLVYSIRNIDGEVTQDFSDSRPAAALESALENDVHIVLHEWTNPYTAAHDGSGPIPAMMDEAFARGVLQVNPVGNLNRSRKHVERSMSPGEDLVVDFQIGDGVEDGFEPYRVVYISLFWRAEHVPKFFLSAPDGQEVELSLDSTELAVGDSAVQATLQQSTRGTYHAKLYLFSDGVLEPGTWSVRIAEIQTQDQLTGRVTDFYSGWRPGVGWSEPTEDRGTLVFPSTTDSAIGVGAVSGRWPEGESFLRSFSGRGPRLDGAIGVDIVAPDDPFAAIALTPKLVEAGYQDGWFYAFGGTSGAAPHVAGTLALWKELWPQDSAQALKDRLLQTATEFDTGLWGAPGNPNVGFGRIDAFGGVFDELRPEMTSPPVFFAVWEGERIEIETDADDLEFALDFRYNGVLDVDWQSGTTMETPVDVGEVRVLARNEYMTSGLVLYRPTTPPMDADPDMGEPATPNPDNCVGCNAVGGAPFWLLVIFWRRRRTFFPPKQDSVLASNPN